MNPATARRLGMTLIEMLVALTATLILMSAVAQMFSVFGAAMSGSRAMLELDAQMRNVAWRLRSDLAGATARPLPPLSADSGEGYFEIIEGPMREPYETEAAGAFIAAADVDDAMLFTARSTDVPFIGRAPTVTFSGTNVLSLTDTFESTLAEIGWFTRKTLPETTPVTYTLYRKQLLVMGYVGGNPFTDNNSKSLGEAPFSSVPDDEKWSCLFNWPCDISARREVNRLYPNSLADLTRREFRFMHNVTGTVSASAFPYPFVPHQMASGTTTSELLPRPALDGLIFDSTSARQGEDVVLTNVLAFDVRVFDPAAPVALSASGNTALVPGDLDAETFPAAPVASGCYVDLGNDVTGNSLLALASGTITPHFAGFGEERSKIHGSLATRRTYDTWSTHYEANGLNEDDNWIDRNNNGIRDPDEGIVDDAINGLDDNNDGVIDDPGEFETSPPYPFPLRGIEVRIRCYEPSSRQVRQVTVRHTFVPH